MATPALASRAPLARALPTLFLTAALAVACSPETQAQARVTAFVGADVIPMDRERVLEDQTVVVRDGRIAQIGPMSQVSAPAGATVVDARGKFLIPGLAEMHAHIPAGNQAEVERTLFLYLAGGVTTIRGMQGSPQHLELRAATAAGRTLGPRIYAAGPGLNPRSAPDPETVRRVVEEQKAAGYDLLKIVGGVSLPTFQALDQTADRVRIPFAGHVSAAVGLNRALASGYASIDHLDSYLEALAGYPDGYEGVSTGQFGFNLTDRVDESRIPALAQATRAAGVWNAPTQTLMEHLASPEDPEVMRQRPEMRYMPPATLDAWVRQKQNFRANPLFTPARAERYLTIRRNLIRALHQAGAGLILGSDAPQWWNVPGFSALRELEYMVTAGLTPYQALATGTLNAARYTGPSADWGTIETGKSADLVLLDANPLTDIRNVWRQAGVMVRGEWLPKTEVDRRLDAIAASVR